MCVWEGELINFNGFFVVASSMSGRLLFQTFNAGSTAWSKYLAFDLQVKQSRVLFLFLQLLSGNERREQCTVHLVISDLYIPSPGPASGSIALWTFWVLVTSTVVAYTSWWNCCWSLFVTDHFDKNYTLVTPRPKGIGFRVVFFTCVTISWYLGGAKTRGVRVLLAQR